MRLLLDTNTVIALLNEPQGPVAQRLRRHAPAEIGLPAIVAHELYYGAYCSQRREHNLAVVDGIRLEVVDFDKEDARHAGEIRAALRLLGIPIGGYDVLIAGQARARNLVLVTRNTREFARVPGLRIETWHGRN